MKKENKRRVLILLSMMLCLLMLLGGCKGKSEEAVPVEEQPEEQTSEGLDSLYGDESLGIDAGVDEQLKDYRLIALFGIDDKMHNDIEMIISLNKNDGSAKIVSVVRDTYMQVSEADGEEPARYNRCNVAYSSGGKYDAIKVLNRNLDLNIRECICVDWQCTADLINALGGIEIDLDENMIPAMNYRLATEDKLDHGGVQTLNGWQTVQYLRARMYKGGDTITRVNNNEEVFMQLYNQAKSMSASEIAEIYDQIADELDTNMSRNTLTDTLAMIATTDIEQTDVWPYDWKRMKGKSNTYRVPDTLISNVNNLHKVLFGQEEYLPSTALQEIQEGMTEKESILEEQG